MRSRIILAAVVGLAVLADGLPSLARMIKDEQTEAFQDALEAHRASGGAGAVIHPVWTVRPDSADVYRTYPPNPRNRHQAGQVVMICMVDKKGRLDPCEVKIEEPAGRGFGTGALILSRLFRMQLVDADSLPVVGRLITIPITYRPTRN